MFLSTQPGLRCLFVSLLRGLPRTLRVLPTVFNQFNEMHALPPRRPLLPGREELRRIGASRTCAKRRCGSWARIQFRPQSEPPPPFPPAPSQGRGPSSGDRTPPTGQRCPPRTTRDAASRCAARVAVAARLRRCARRAGNHDMMTVLGLVHSGLSARSDLTGERAGLTHLVITIHRTKGTL